LERPFEFDSAVFAVLQKSRTVLAQLQEVF